MCVRRRDRPVVEEDVPMRHVLRSAPVMVEETHRATTFEIFFDLVFVFALTRITAFMAQEPTPTSLAQGLLLLLWFWYAWTCYTWLGNRARADVGPIRAGTTVAMAAIFVAALVIPDAWRHGSEPVDASLTLALAYLVVRALHLALYFHSAAGNRRSRRQVLRFAIPTALAWAPLILGALFGGTTQTLLWAVAFVIDYGGGRIAAGFSQWEIRSPSHFTERHGLVLIIALGESLISVGAGAGSAVTRVPVLVAGLLGFTTAVCLWWLYFDKAAPAAAQQLASAPGDARRRQRLASDAYALAHLPLIAGIIYLALGIHEVLAQVAHAQPGHTAGVPLDWPSTVALYGGAVLYLIGRYLFLRLAVGSTSPAQLVAIGAALVLLPVSRILPALPALGLLTVLLTALACYERLSRPDHNPPTNTAS
jgi:low temperature requirement protein LtrA